MDDNPYNDDATVEETVDTSTAEPVVTEDQPVVEDVTPEADPAPEPTTPPTPTQATIDVNQLAQVLQNQNKPQEQQAPQPTQEEIDKMFQKFTMNEEHYANIFENEDKAAVIETFNNVLQSAVQQAVATMYHVQQEAFANQQQILQPYMQYADEVRSQAVEARYYDQFPDHKNYTSVINAVQQQMKTENYSAQSEKEVFTEVAKRVDEMVKSLGVTPQTTQTQTPEAPQVPTPATLRGASKSGQAPSGKAPDVNADAKMMFA